MFEPKFNFDNTVLSDYETIIFDLDGTLWDCFKPDGTGEGAYATSSPYKLQDRDHIIDSNGYIVTLQPGVREFLSILYTNDVNLGILSKGEKLSDLTSKTPIPFESQPSVMLLKKFDIYKYFNYDIILKSFSRKSEYLKPLGRTLFIDDEEENILDVNSKGQEDVDVARRQSFSSWLDLLQAKKLSFMQDFQKLAWGEDDFVEEYTDKEGDLVRRNFEGKYHSLYSPAVEYADGDKFWYQNGVKHRLDGPAGEYLDGSKRWYYNGGLWGTSESGYTQEKFEEDLRKDGKIASQNEYTQIFPESTDLQPTEIIQNLPSSKRDNNNLLENRLDFNYEKNLFEKGLHQRPDQSNDFRPITPYGRMSLASLLSFSSLYFYPNVELDDDEYQEVVNFLKNEGSELSETTFNKFQFLSNFEDLKEHFELKRWHTIWESLVNDEVGKRFVDSFNHSRQDPINYLRPNDKSSLLKTISDYTAYTYIINNVLSFKDLEILTFNPNLSDKTLSLIYPKVRYSKAAVSRLKSHVNFGELTSSVVNSLLNKELDTLTLPEKRQIKLVERSKDLVLLTKLSDSQFSSVRHKIANNPNTPIEVLTKLSNDSDSRVRRNIAYNPNTPIEVLTKLSNDSDARIRQNIANNPNTPIEVLTKLSNDSNAWVRQNIAYNSNTPIEVLTKLSNDSDSNVRYRIANNTNTPIEVLTKLSNDSDFMVRQSIAYNSNTPIEVLTKLSNDLVGSVRQNIAENPNTPIEILNKLSNDSDARIRQNIANNTNTPIEVLTKLSNDSNAWVRRGIANNTNTPIEVLTKLSNDSDSSVRQVAGQILAFSKSQTITKDEMKARNYSGKESFDHKVVGQNSKNYMYDLGVNGQDWTRLIYSTENDIPQGLYQSFNIHHKVINNVTGHDKFLGWIGGKFDSDTKSLYVTEMQSDLLQRTFELRKPIFVQKGYDKYKSRIENMYNGWQKVFFNQALREARDRKAEFVYVPTSAFYKAKHKDAPTQYYDYIVQSYPHTTIGNWNVIDMRTENLKIASLLFFGSEESNFDYIKDRENQMFQFEPNETPGLDTLDMQQSYNTDFFLPELEHDKKENDTSTFDGKENLLLWANQKLSWGEGDFTTEEVDLTSRSSETRGAIYRKNDKDEFHSLYSPAIEWRNGNKYWYQNNKQHRLDGPAVEYANGYKSWYYEDEWYGNSTEGYNQEKFEDDLRREGKIVS